MLETGDSYPNVRKLRIAVFIVFVLAALSPASVFALSVEKAEWHVDSATLQKGYTFQTTGSEIRLGMPSASINAGEEDEAWVRLRQVKKTRVEIPKPKKLLSRIYGYAVLNTKDTVTVDQPLWLSVVWNIDTDQDYVIKAWDAEKEKWTPLETTVHIDEHRALTTVTEAKGVVAVFSKKKNNELYGKASWYNWYGAAMNDLPLGTQIEVENPATGATARTTVVSTGPFIPGRIIDLPKEVFAEIGNPSAGVMDVIVRPLD